MVWNWRRKATGLVLASVCFAVGGLIYNTYTNNIPAVFAAEKENLLNASSIILSVGDSYSLSLYGAEKVLWRTGRASVATVSNEGIVKGIAVGTTIITATANGQNYRCTVRVEQPKINKKEISAKVGDNVTLKISGTKRKIIFKSSDTKVVKVSAKGKMTFLKPGKAKVSALIGNTQLVCKVTVNIPSITIPSMLGEGTVKAIDLGWETYKGILFSSSAPEVVAVDENGILTAKKSGQAKITVKIKNFRKTQVVTVPGTVSSAILTGQAIGLGKKDTQIAELAHEVYTKSVTDSMDIVEKILAIHDYLILHTEYAYREYLDGTLDQIPYVFCPEGVLVQHKAVCQGYAETLELFLNALGLENRLVFGYGYTENGRISHAWNLVKLDDNWYHIDMTWDDPIVNGIDSGKVYYDYFLVNDAVMKKNHTWEMADYPAAIGGEYEGYGIKKEVEKYQKAGQYIETKDDYAKKTAEQVMCGKRTVTLMFPGHVQPDINAMLKLVAEHNPGKKLHASYEYFFYGDYTISTSYITIE